MDGERQNGTTGEEKKTGTSEGGGCSRNRKVAKETADIWLDHDHENTKLLEVSYS